MIQRALENGVQIYTNLIMKYAIATLLVLVLITISFLKGALTFEENMTRDIEVYLPEGEESTDILIEVREDWATDLIIVYVETLGRKVHQDYALFISKNRFCDHYRIEE